MYEGPGLSTIPIDGDTALVIGVKNKTVYYRVETHTFIIPVDITTPDDVSLHFIEQPIDMFLTPQFAYAIKMFWD